MVSERLQVQLPDSGICDTSVQERQAMLPRIWGPERRQDGRGCLGLQHVYGASQQRWEHLKIIWFDNHAAWRLQVLHGTFSQAKAIVRTPLLSSWWTSSSSSTPTSCLSLRPAYASWSLHTFPPAPGSPWQDACSSVRYRVLTGGTLSQRILSELGGKRFFPGLLYSRDRGWSRALRTSLTARPAPGLPATAWRGRAPAAWRTEAGSPGWETQSQETSRGMRRAIWRRRMMKMGFSVLYAYQVMKIQL